MAGGTWSSTTCEWQVLVFTCAWFTAGYFFTLVQYAATFQCETETCSTPGPKNWSRCVFGFILFMLNKQHWNIYTKQKQRVQTTLLSLIHLSSSSYYYIQQCKHLLNHFTLYSMNNIYYLFKRVSMTIGQNLCCLL